jgi:tRNA modification GTPase
MISLEDTIAAIATPLGTGALAVLRLSGPDAGSILLRVCPDLRGRLPEPRRQVLLSVQHPATGEVLDRGLVTRFAAPRSYTGEEVVEVTTHGGALTPQLVLAALLEAGARRALPGEFTSRAYANGKLDLLQAEAVLDLIEGRSEALHRVAVHQMDRGLSRRVGELRDAIVRTEALIVYSIDFPDEDEPPVPPQRIVESGRAVLERVRQILLTAPQGETLREGALTVLAGLPNSGKSSLFNALLGLERAIVTDIPGTTRDALDAAITLDGYPFRLVDTAGLRASEDPVERIGIEVARSYLNRADIVLFCAEASRALVEEERAFLGSCPAGRTILVRTKLDANAGESGVEAAGDQSWEGRRVALSAWTGDGLEGLRAELLGLAFGSLLVPGQDAPVVTRARHTQALRAAADELEGFLAAVTAATPMELAATHLRAAIAALEDLIGVVAPDDVLGDVFSQFCVGK